MRYFVFWHGYNRSIYNLNKTYLLKILTRSNIYVGTYKTDTYENMSISILSQYSNAISVQTSIPSYFLYTMLPPPIKLNSSQ
jgi:hypothetical protein